MSVRLSLISFEAPGLSLALRFYDPFQTSHWSTPPLQYIPFRKQYFLYFVQCPLSFVGDESEQAESGRLYIQFFCHPAGDSSDVTLTFEVIPHLSRED